MGNLLTSLFNSASALQVFDRSLSVIQNNIVNANTPGYVKQNLDLVALPFDPAHALSGGVFAGPLLTARSEYLENAVRTQQEQLGSARQRAEDLGQVEPLFDLSASSGVASSINKLYDSFSQLSVNPNDTVSRQGVIDQAGQVAQSIRNSAAVADQTRNVVASINAIGQQLAEINRRFRSDSQSTQDAGLDAQVHTALENLSELTDFTVIKTSDGTYSVAIGGQTPLVIGDKSYAMSVDLSSPQTSILDQQGNDITSQISRGRLGTLIAERNTTIPGYVSQLNTLAQGLADTVNGTLAQGVDQNGATPLVNLFTYNQASDAASTISVSNLTPDQIAAALPAAPGGNGNAIALAQLATAQTINGYTFTQFYGTLGSRVGRDVAAAKQDQDAYQTQLTQARGVRASQTGVSLDEEATRLLQLQQSYQAAGKLVGVLQTLTQSVIDLIH